MQRSTIYLERLVECRSSAGALWPILVTLAGLAAEDERADDAQALRTQACTIIRHIADHAGGPELRASFLHQPVVQTLLEGA